MTPEQEQTIRTLHAQGVEGREIADAVGEKYDTVRYWISKLNLPSNQIARIARINRIEVSPEQRAQIFKLYGEGNSMRSIAADVSLSRGTVHKVLLTENRILTPISAKKEKTKRLNKNAKAVTTKATKYSVIPYTPYTNQLVTNAGSTGLYTGEELQYRK